jgi:hypothetical protein
VAGVHRVTGGLVADGGVRGLLDACTMHADCMSEGVVVRRGKIGSVEGENRWPVTHGKSVMEIVKVYQHCPFETNVYISKTKSNLLKHFLTRSCMMLDRCMMFKIDQSETTDRSPKK